MAEDWPNPLTPCPCPHGHGQMLLQWGPTPGVTTKHWTWICAVCRTRRTWPDQGALA